MELKTHVRIFKNGIPHKKKKNIKMKKPKIKLKIENKIEN